MSWRGVSQLPVVVPSHSADPAPSRWERELEQRWPYGLSALFIGVLLPVVSGHPLTERRIGEAQGKFGVLVIMTCAFFAVMLLVASVIGRRRREAWLAATVLLLLSAHPVVDSLVEARTSVTPSIRVLAGGAALVLVTLSLRAPVGFALRLLGRLAIGLAFIAASLAAMALAREGETFGPSAWLALAMSAVAAGTLVLIIGQRQIDGAQMGLGFLALGIGFSSWLALLPGGGEITVGGVVLGVVTSVLALASGFLAVVEALHRRDTVGEAARLARTLELERLSSQSARFEEVAHDQRSALLAIEAAAQGLASRPSGDLANAVAEEARRMRRALEGVDTCATTFDINARLASFVTYLQPLHGEIEIADVVLQVWADADDVVEIVLALVDNAHLHGAGQVRITATQRGESVVVAVTDEGAGVPFALRQSVFERGATSRPADHSGLGLYSARRLAVLNHGDLQVADGNPATFELSLPRSRPIDQVAMGDGGDVIDLRSVKHG